MIHADSAGATPVREFKGGAGVGVSSDPQETSQAADLDSADTANAEEISGGLSWRLPPVRWGGNLAMDFRADRIGNQTRRLRLTELTNIKASSYIYQPWFALVSGGLGFVAGRERVSETVARNLDQSSSTRFRAVTGNGELTLFPVSRFPFNAYYDVSDSRASGEPITDDFKNTRWGLRQSYRPPEGGDNYVASFNRSTLESPSFGRDTVNALEASMNRYTAPQTFDLAARYTSNTRSATGEHIALSEMHARSSYVPEPALSVDSLASLSNSDYRLLLDGVPSDNRSSFAQASTFATWRPQEYSSLFLTGGGRLFRSAIELGGDKAQTLTLSANLAATYALNRQTNISAGTTATQLVTDSVGRLVTTQSAAVTRISDPVGIFGANYSWNMGANFSNQTGIPEGARQELGGQFGHNFNRSVTLSENSQADFGFGQSAGVSYDSVTGRAQTLNNNANASWRLYSATATSAYMSLLGTDSRTSGVNANHFQMLNFQVSGQVQFNQVSYAAANLTVQAIRQSTAGKPPTTAPGHSSGNLSYFRQHAFGVPRLRYAALYNINDSQFRSRLQGDVDAPRERVDQSFEQRLDYSLGRIALRLSMRFARIEGRREALIFFRVDREFGSF